MITDPQRYLLCISFQPTNGRDPATVKSPILATCPTIYHAISALIALPMDQFHPDTAKNCHLGHFVDTVELYDLSNGQLAATTLRAQLLADDDQIALSLQLGAAYPAQILLPDLVDDDQLLQPGSRLIPLLTYFARDRCLIPTEQYNELFDRALVECIDPDAILNPGIYSCSLEGYALGKAYLVDDRIRYPSLTQIHYHDQLVQALSQFVFIPTHYFDKDHAFQLDLSRHFESGLIRTLREEQSRLFEFFVTPAPDPGEGTPPELAGLFLTIYPGAFDPLKHIIDWNGLRPNTEPVSIQLATWTLEDQYLLRPTESLNTIRLALQKHYAGLAHETDFEVVHLPTVKMPPYSGGQPNPTILFSFHAHTNDLGVGLFELTYQPLGHRDLRMRAVNGNDLEMVLSTLKDRQGNPIAAIIDSLEGQNAGETIYLYIKSELLDHPQLERLAPFQLQQGAPNPVQQLLGKHFFAIGHKEDGQIEPSLGYLKYQLLQKAVFIQDQLKSRPELRKEHAHPAHLFPFTVSLNWELGSAAAAARQVNSQIGFDSIAQAVLCLYDLPKELFSANAYSGQPFSLQLKTAMLTRKNTRSPILSAGSDDTKGGRVIFTLHEPASDQTLKALMDLYIPEFKSAPPQTGIPHRSRTFTPTRQKKSKGPGGQ